ncbi:DUF885 domain-containing protein [Caulobacter sp. KR2-114]|uniref:DUF885 domain-containing protein n=1 Tax=Caulobacter sp. KR2-114 TaxID=3400912 RepID=UPI003C0D30EF
MSLSRRHFLLASAAAGLAPALGARAQTSAGDPRLDALFAGFVEQMLAESPETATSLGLDQGARAGLKRRLADRSIAGAGRLAAETKGRLKALEAFDVAGLGEQARLNRDVALYAHRLGVDGARFVYGDNTLASAMNENAGPYLVSQQTGAFAAVPEMLDAQHGVSSAEDAEAWLARLEALGAALDQETERVRRDAGLGVAPPRFILDTALGQMTAFRATPAVRSRLSTALGRKAAAASLAGDWAGRAARLTDERVYPALQRQIETLTALCDKAGDEAGVWRLPDGEAYYAWLLKVGTSTAMTADQVHQMGLDQVAEITARMDGLLKAQGLTQGGVGERVTALAHDPRFVFADDDQGRAQILDYLNGRIAAVRPLLPRAFRTTNRADVVVKRVPPDIEAGQGLGYMNGGSMDGSRPAIYYINLKDTAMWPRWKLPTLTYHETIPGHVWQGAYITERHLFPLIDSFWGFNAYVEGWALYAEQLADEMGLYDDDPFGRIGYLQAQQFRASRLVVDTGMHAKRWTREQAIAWLREHTGYGRPEAQSEIDRYISTPGQACGYKVGHSELNRQRDRAKAALGARFDLRDFNDAVVLCGGVPLQLMDGVIDRYIAHAKSA